MMVSGITTSFLGINLYLLLPRVATQYHQGAVIDRSGQELYGTYWHNALWSWIQIRTDHLRVGKYTRDVPLQNADPSTCALK
jgi:hypothetical protein